MSEPSAGGRVGEFVLLGAPETDEHVPAIVIGAGEDGPTVVPISEQVELAGDWDVILDRELLGYEAIAEIWNYGTVLPEQIVAAVKPPDPAVTEAVTAIARAATSGGAAPAEAVTGPPIVDDADPRLLFQGAESERLRVFWEPTLVLAGAMTLGQLVRHRREDLGLAQRELEDLGPRPGWIPELERDALDIPANVQPPALARLMRRLRISASRRLGRIAATTLEAGAPALARKGEARPAADVDAYIAAFLDELERDDQ